MKRIRIVKTKPAQIHWTREAYKEVKASSCIYSNILFIINSNKICEIEFYNKGFYTRFYIENKIRISNKCIEKYLSFLNEQ